AALAVATGAGCCGAGLRSSATCGRGCAGRTAPAAWAVATFGWGATRGLAAATAGCAGGGSGLVPPNPLLPELNRLPNIEPDEPESAEATRVGAGGGTDAVVVSESPRLTFFGGLTLLPIAGTRWVEASEKMRPFSSNLSFERSLARKSSF